MIFPYKAANFDGWSNERIWNYCMFAMLTGMFAGGAVSMVLPSSFVALFYGLLASVVFVYLLLTSKKVQKWISKYKPVKAN